MQKNFLVPDREAYECGNCGEIVMGGRYNNHCPKCLWSRHMDDQVPGDRLSKCKAMMEPIGSKQEKGKWRIVHECVECGKKMIVDVNADDDFDLVVKLSLGGVID